MSLYSNISMMEWSLLTLSRTTVYFYKEVRATFGFISYESMKGFRKHAEFLRHRCGLGIIFFYFVCLWKVLSKVLILKISSKLKGPSNDQKALQIINPR